jgi:predicted TIM-barrel fold metal-dependent hydrolase
LGPIDVHTHLTPPGYLDAVSALVDDPDVGATVRATLALPQRADPMLSGELDERIRLMDEAGIDVHVLSFSTPNIWHPDAAVRTRVVRAFNDGCAEVAAAWPGRIRYFANLPLPHVQASIDEATRALEDPGAVGVGVCTHFAHRPIDDPEFEPLYAALDERAATVFFHPDGFCTPGIFTGVLMEWGVGAPLDDTIAAARIVLSGLVDRFPNVTWIVPHLGGAFPFLLGRLDLFVTQGPNAAPPDQAPSARLGNLLFDHVGPDTAALRLARDVLGVDHLVYGSDFPAWSRHDLARDRRRLVDAGFTPDEIGAIERGNVAARLGLPA